MIPDFYTHRPEWLHRIERIGELLGRISAVEELSGRVPELRRSNRIGSVHSSTAIEGNQLSLAQVADVAKGAVVYAAPRDVKEVENALAAYEALGDLDPWSVADLLRAHGLLTAGLVDESGRFRTVDVDIVGSDGTVLHTGSRQEKVPRLMAELLDWGSGSADHPLVVSSAVHFLIEHIHPFRDGNGRIGRLWQTLILSRWRPVFAWMPTETLIRQNQAGYYGALQASRVPEIDAAPFIEYMLGVVVGSLETYERHASDNASHGDVSDDLNDDVNERLLVLLRENPRLSAAALARQMGVSIRTAQRRRNQLRDAGRIRHIGPAKTGHWEVVHGE
ncbi:MAG: Fic family protein [Arachnia sp.]